MSALLADWRRSKQRMDMIARDLPRMVGVETKKIIRENFLLQGYDDGVSFQMWKAREPATNKRYDHRYGVRGSVFQSSNPVLHQTGDLENAVDYKVERFFISGSGGTQLHVVIFMGVNLDLIPYAQIHNEGGHGMAWGKVPFTMPKRKYMPAPGERPNAKMLKAYEAKLKYEIRQAMQTFSK